MKSILFVDDEAAILRSFKRAFRKTDYQLFFADSGKMALDLLQKDHVDMVITDVRMPQMDGYELLKEVRKRDWSILRLVISGYTDKEEMVQEVMNGTVHSYFSKPWDNEQVIGYVNHLFELSDSLKDREIHNLVTHNGGLPIMSDSYEKIMSAINGNADIATITNYIAESPQLVAHILQLANSAFYGLHTGDIKRAVSFVGLDTVHDILVLLEIASLVPNDTAAQRLVNHSLKTSKIFHKLYEAYYKKKVPAEISAAPLLHDVGCFFYLKKFGISYEEVLEEGCSEVHTLSMEEALSGTTHDLITAYLLDWWNLPFALVRLITLHHKEVDKEWLQWQDVALLQLADYFANPHKETLKTEKVEELLKDLSLHKEEVENIVTEATKESV